MPGPRLLLLQRPQEPLLQRRDAVNTHSLTVTVSQARDRVRAAVTILREQGVVTLHLPSLADRAVVTRPQRDHERPDSASR